MRHVMVVEIERPIDEVAAIAEADVTPASRPHEVELVGVAEPVSVATIPW